MNRNFKPLYYGLGGFVLIIIGGLIGDKNWFHVFAGFGLLLIVFTTVIEIRNAKRTANRIGIAIGRFGLAALLAGYPVSLGFYGNQSQSAIFMLIGSILMFLGSFFRTGK